jgi:hypothetical protein
MMQINTITINQYYNRSSNLYKIETVDGISYRTNFNGSSWERLYGESWEPVYDDEKKRCQEVWDNVKGGLVGLVLEVSERSK